MLIFTGKMKQEDNKHMTEAGGKLNAGIVYLTLVFYLLNT